MTWFQASCHGVGGRLKSFDQQLTKARRQNDVDEEVCGVVDARQSERGVEDDAAGRGLFYQLQQQRREHPRRLADEEDNGHDEQCARKPPVVRLTLIGRQIALQAVRLHCDDGADGIWLR